jgi:predicted enzyme related to lactoylglutathione lyase
MAPVIEGLRAVPVHVTDLARARSFYTEVLGLVEEPPVPNVPRIAFKLPGSPTRLTMHVQRPGAGGREPGTVSGILLQCGDPVAACATVREHGGTIRDEPWTMPRGASTIVRAVIADPDGNGFILSAGW